MSFTDTAAVMEMTDLPLNEWKVLLALAHHRNSDTGICNPGYRRIAKYAHVSEGHVGEYLTKLEELGLISIVSGKLKQIPNSYTLRVDTLPEVVPPGYPPRGVRTVTLQAHARSGSAPLVREKSTETVLYRTKPIDDSLREDTGETPGPPETAGALPLKPRRRGFSPPDPSVDMSPAASSPSPRPPTLSYDEAQTLTQLYCHLSGYTDLVDALGDFCRYSGPLSSAVIANAMRWAYKKSSHWGKVLEPTAGDFLRALKTIHQQYEKFYLGAKEGKKPHDVWTAEAVLEQEVPAPPLPLEKQKTYLEGEVAVESGDEVEMLPKSKAFQLED